MSGLDQSQRAFVEATVAANIRLLAPAGCGKTLCLLHRCKYLAEQSPDRRKRFLIVTFTRAARDELKGRLNEDREFLSIRDQTEITTLNAWGFRRIRGSYHSPKLISSQRDFHFTMNNQLQPIWKAHGSVQAAIESTNRWKSSQAPKRLMNVVDALKSLGFDHIRHKDETAFSDHWDAIARQGLDWRLEELCQTLIRFDVLPERADAAGTKLRKTDLYDRFFRFWVDACEHLRAGATFTLEDQKYIAYLDERQNVEDKRFLSGAASYDHVFIDEFQDINPLDLALVRAIVDRNRGSLTIAGDDDQAIFEWRGATPEYILGPEQFFYSSFDTHTLSVNYRSPANIVNRSQDLIANNTRRVPKRVQPYSRDNAKIDVVRVESLYAAMEIVHDLVRSTERHCAGIGKIALISGRRSQIIPYQIFFASQEIAFCAAEDLQIFLSETFERLLELLTIKADVYRRQRPAQVAKHILFLCDFVRRYRLNRTDKFELRKYLDARRSRTLASAIDDLAQYRGRLKGKNEAGATSLAMAESIRAYISAESVADALNALSQCFEGLHLDLGKAEEDIFYTDPPFAQLAEYAKRYGKNYDSFVEDLESAKDTLIHTPPFDETDSGDDLSRHSVHLMTALRAKGKEFDKVVLLDVQDGIWPHKNARTHAELEAQRRVFYVAFTRAKKQVTMLLRKGETPSPYIAELGLTS